MAVTVKDCSRAKLRMQNLIIVPGHGVCRPGSTGPNAVGDDESWCGTYPREARFYVEHVRSGVEISHRRPSSLLMFSGGQTRAAAGPRSEAQSYFEIARDHDWWSHAEVVTRTALEEYARDGFENLVFSLARFRQVTGTWPSLVVITGWAFKRQRYEAYGRLINLPLERLEYVGVNQPPSNSLLAAIDGEKARIAELKRAKLRDLLDSDELRTRRDPFSRGNPYVELVADLFRELGV